MDPSSAVSLWQQYLKPLKNQGYMLISPACTNGPSGMTWMKSFLDECTDCQIDRVGLHFYGTEPQDFINYVTEVYNAFKIPVWVTEFACQNFGGGEQCTAEQVQNFLQTVTEWMDKTTYVDAYFAFGVLDNMSNVNPLDKLMDNGGGPNSLGKLYLGL
jgi:O-glycosyl hydrolase